MTNRISVILVLVGILLFIPTCSSLFMSLNESSPRPTVVEIKDEDYSIDIASIQSIEDFETRIVEEIDEKELSGIEIPILVDDYVRKKFYRKFSYMRWYDNWTLSIIDLLVPRYQFMGYLDPDQIIEFDHAICNQQAIVFQKVIENLGFEYGSIRFSAPDFGHFTSAVKVDDKWYYFDTNLEPIYDRNSPEIFNDVISGNKETLTSMYGDRFAGLSSQMVKLDDVNSFPASKGVLVQEVSGFLSWYGWAMFAFPGVLGLWSRRRSQGTGKPNLPS